MRSLTQVPERVGIELGESGGMLVVTAVAPGSVAHRSAQVAVGLVVLTINGSKPTCATALNGTIAGGTVMHVRFVRPQPEIPYHGSARKGIHKSVQYKMTGEQRDWLEANVFNGGDRRIRDKEASIAMKAKFYNRIRTDTMTPVWLEQSQIAAWLVKQVRDEKDRRKMLRLEKQRGCTPDAGSTAKRAKCTEGRGKEGGRGKEKVPAGPESDESGDEGSSDDFMSESDESGEEEDAE